MYVLIIKGKAKEAKKAAEQKGFKVIKTESSIRSLEETRVYVSIPNRDIFIKMASWLSETKKTPFPPGTLLYYSLAK